MCTHRSPDPTFAFPPKANSENRKAGLLAYPVSEDLPISCDTVACSFGNIV